jgi:hypothetical protein
VLGFVSSRIYLRQQTEGEKASMNATAKALSSDVDYHLSYLRQYYISLFSSDGLSSLQEYMEPPFLHLIDVVAEQNLLSGDASITNDVQSYYYINVASRWVVSN